MARSRSALAARRMAVGFTQESLAERLGVERSTIARWEHGDSVPQPWARRKLADALAVSLEDVDALISGPDNRMPDSGRIAISGSRAAGTDGALIDACVAVLARMVMVRRLKVNHGPVGVGIEVMTYVADRYRPADFTMTPTLFGRANVVRGADLVVVLGGATGTADELDLAVSMGVPVVPFPATGGTARRFYESAANSARLGSAIPASLAPELGTCSDADEFVLLVERQVSEGASQAS